MIDTATTPALSSQERLIRDTIKRLDPNAQIDNLPPPQVHDVFRELVRARFFNDKDSAQ